MPMCNGKWVRQKSVIATNNVVELPKELDIKGPKVALAINMFFVNNKAFLHAIDQKVKLNSCVVLGTKKKKEGYDKEILFSGIDKVLWFYNHADAYIKTIHADNEFCSFMEELIDQWDVDINFSNPGEHVPDIKRDNKTQQERFRVNLYWPPFKIIPHSMIHYLNLQIAKNCSLFPKKNGISRYYLPHTILNFR